VAGYIIIMTQLLIVYHTRTEGSRLMAEAAREGAQSEISTRLLRAEDTGPEHMLEAEGYIFCAPENLASLSGPMKDFFDRCYYPVLGRIEGRGYAQMICAGSDGEGAARQIARIAQGWRLKPVQDPLIVCTHAQSAEEILATKNLAAEELAPCRELGQALGAGLSMGVF
jgi:multimeric flavodoxin WrbA